MQIAKTDHDSGLGIYAKSKKIVTTKDWEDAKGVSHEIIAYMDENNGKFQGNHPQAYALAHCQLAPISEPLNLFVVAKELVLPDKPENDNQTLVNTFFEAQAIFNAEILEQPAKIEREVPQRKIIHDKGKSFIENIVKEKKLISNLINVPEACMSFPQRKAKNTDRFHTIKVRYQYLHKGIMGTTAKTFEGWVEGLKAHILQHECDHFQAKNIFYKT